MTDETSPTGLLDMTVGIVANYVSNNAVTAEALPGLIASVHAALANTETAEAPVEEAVERPSAAQVRRSVSEAGLVSFIDGRTYQSLKRHLSGHGMTPDDYRARFGLRSDYPMVSPAYAARRSVLAKAIGLGQKGRQPKTAAPKIRPAPRKAK